MEFSEIITAISTVGYPIIMSLIVAWYVKYTQDAHKNEVDKLAESVNNNTLVIEKLIESLKE